MFANPLNFAEADAAVRLARAAEAHGFDSLWTVEHPIIPAGYQPNYPYSRSGRLPGGDRMDLPDPLIWLTWVGAHTSTIRLATGILVLPLRSPAVVAKEVATLDRLCSGRVLLGVGAGWMPEEFEAVGMPFARRGARLDSAIETLRALWTGEETTIHDEFVSIERGVCRPTPTHGRVPIIIGGQADVAARRAGRLGDGYFPMGADLPRALKLMREAAEDAGRDPDAIEVTIGMPPGADPHEAIDEATRLGVSRVLVPPPATSADSIADALADFAQRIGVLEKRRQT
jgi:probable F420-dependent oxidoreductase